MNPSSFFSNPVTDTARLLLARGAAMTELREQAGQERMRLFGDRVFVRGVIEISNFCRENCEYCGMRRDNASLKRFRLQKDRIMDLLARGLPDFVKDLNFQSGEDPRVIEEIVLPLIQYLRIHTTLGVSLSLGTLSPSHYHTLLQAGASYYILKLETADGRHYRGLQAPGTLEERLAAIRNLAKSGWYVSSGMILGLPGQTVAMAGGTLDFLGSLPLAGVSVSPFIPGEATPFAGESSPDPETVINAVALLRLANPEKIIPAVSAMNLLGEDRYSKALGAGANLVTLNLTPPQEQADYLLYSRRRIIMNRERIERALQQAGAVPSPIGLSEYLNRKNREQAGLRGEFA